MPTYTFDPTGQALQNKVVGEIKALNLPALHDYLFVVPQFGPFFEDSLSVKFTPSVGTPRILEPFVDYNVGLQYLSATAKTNRAIYGAFSLVDITLVGTVTFNYQAMGGLYEITAPQIASIQANEVRDPIFTTWETTLTDRAIPLFAIPTIDHPWSKVNVSDIKRATDELEEAGLVVHLRPKFLPTPGDADFIPSATEIGLGNVDNYQTATNQEAITGTATNRFMTPAVTKNAVGSHVLTYLAQAGYSVPTPYVAGITITTNIFTVSYQDNVYAARAQYLPFTTNGSFEKEKFVLVRSNQRDHWSDPITWTVVGNEVVSLTGAKTFNTNLTFTAKIDTKIVLNNFTDLVYKTDYQLDNGKVLIEYPLAIDDKIDFYYRAMSSNMPDDRDYYKLFEVTSGVNAFNLPDMDVFNASDLRVTLNDFIVLTKDVDYTIVGSTLTVTYTLKLNDVLEVENISTIPFLGKQQMREILTDVADVNTAVVDDGGLKEPFIVPGATGTYFKGNKGWGSLATDVRATVLTGLSLLVSSAVVATDTVLAAVGKLQKQINDTISNLASTATGKGAALIGFKQAGTGSVARTLQDKLRESVSVLDFGADPTGQTSSSIAFQKAFDHAAIISESSAGPITTNLSVFVPAGLYYIDYTVSVDKRIGLYGEGVNTVITGNSPSAMSPATCGFRFNSPAPTGIAPHIHHLTFFGFNGGPCISIETSGAMVENCFFSNSVSSVDLNSDSLGNAASDIIISSSIFDQMLADVRLYSAVNVSILGCQSFLSGYGIQFLSTGVGNSDILISGCEFNYTKTSSVFADSSTNKNIQVNGCSFMLNQQHSSFIGFVYTGPSTVATEIFVKNCTFRNWKDYAVRFYGANIFSISDCIFDAAKTVASYTQSAASKAIVLTGCTLSVMVQNCQFRNVQNALIDGYTNSVCNLLHGAATNSNTLFGNDGSCTLNPRGFISSSGNALYGTQSDTGRPLQVKGQLQFGDSINGSSTGVVLYENGSDSGILGYQNIPLSIWVNLTKSFIFNATGSVHYIPLNSAPLGAIKGDVYYDNALNKMRAYDGVSWNNLF